MDLVKRKLTPFFVLKKRKKRKRKAVKRSWKRKQKRIPMRFLLKCVQFPAVQGNYFTMDSVRLAVVAMHIYRRESSKLPKLNLNSLLPALGKLDGDFRTVLNNKNRLHLVEREWFGTRFTDPMVFYTRSLKLANCWSNNFTLLSCEIFGPRYLDLRQYFCNIPVCF